MKNFSRRRLPGFEVASIDCGGSHSFAPHFHDEFVISVNVSGLERIKLDGKNFEAKPREVTLYNPAQVQSSFVVSDSWHFYSIYVDPTILETTFDLSPDTAFDQPVLPDARVAAQMEAAIRFALYAGASDGEALERIIGTFDELLELAGSINAPSPPYIPLVIRRVAERLHEERVLPTLQELARDAGLTPVQLVRAFAKVYRMPPMAWAMLHASFRLAA